MPRGQSAVQVNQRMTERLLVTLAKIACTTHELAAALVKTKFAPPVAQSKMANELEPIEIALTELAKIAVPLLSPPQHRLHNRHKFEAVNGVKRDHKTKA